MEAVGAEMIERKPERMKYCGHEVGYRCCCHAHQDAEQDQQDLVKDLAMPVGYKLARAYSRELHGDQNLDD